MDDGTSGGVGTVAADTFMRGKHLMRGGRGWVEAGGKGTNLAGSKAVCRGNRRILLLCRYFFFRVEVTPSKMEGWTGRQTDRWALTQAHRPPCSLT